MLTICAWCQRILHAGDTTHVSHGICPACKERVLAEAGYGSTGKALTPTQRYKVFKDSILAERGCICEACQEFARHLHHIIPVSETSIHSDLVFEPANVLVLCDACHCLMHPNFRRYPWTAVRIGRSHALNA